MRRTLALTVLALTTASLLASAAFAAGANGRAVQTFPQRSAGFVDIGQELADRDQLHRWLVAEMIAEALDAPVRVVVTDDDLQALDRPAESQPSPVRVGLVRPVEETISFAGLTPGQLRRQAQSLSTGAIRGTADGGYVFTASVTSPGATAMRLHFSDFWVPAAADLYLFTLEGEVFGPYNLRGPHEDGDFWSHTLMGDQVVLQIRHHGPVSARDLKDTWFHLQDVGYLGSKLVAGLTGNDPTQRSFCQFNASCVENNSCTSNPAVNDAESAVAHMQWIAGAFLYICSGGLIGDRAGSGTPYFLTANHCISRNKDAKNLECFFQYSVSCATTTCDDLFDIRDNYPQSLRTLGSSVKASGSTGDYTLLELNQSPPAGSVFMGWTTDPVAFSNGADLYRVSHPGGAPQAFSSHSVDTSATTCLNTARGDWIYSRDTFGATEGGSSGSPVVNSSGQVVGQLTGSCGYNTGDPCDADSNATIDGAFASYFSNVSEFLDPVPCDPSPEVCDDGADNDCDGAVDCSDSDCTGDPACQGGGCGSHGASCATGADCCSGNCKRGSCKGS